MTLVSLVGLHHSCYIMMHRHAGFSESLSVLDSKKGEYRYRYW